MTVTIPDFETLVINRLAICNGEIKAQGLKAVFAQPPITAPDMGDFPLASVRVGPMLDPIPAVSAGLVIVRRNYIIDLPVAPLENTTDTGNAGADAETLALKWFAIIRNYYINHPHLQTEAGLNNDPLQYIYGDIELIDGGMIQMGAPGGSNYVGTKYTLTISMRAKATHIS